eukprot:502789_1
MSNNSSTQSSIKQQNKQATSHSYNSNANINQICFCKKQMTKFQYEWSVCRCCCSVYNPNEMEFYWCGRGTQCEYVKICAFDYIICKTCFNARYNEIDDNKNDFMTTKTKANMKIISEETKKLNDIQQRKKYMWRIYFYLYQGWIAKLNNNELT